MYINNTYFAKYNKMVKEGTLPEDSAFVAITVKAPYWWKGFHYPKLAPSSSILNEYKNGGGEERYIERFNDEILSKLDKDQILKELKDLTHKDVIYLVCYEGEGKFCHRHIVQKWLQER